MLCCTIDCIVVLALGAAVPSTTSFDVAHSYNWKTCVSIFHDSMTDKSPTWLAMLLASLLGRRKGGLDTGFPCESYTGRPSLYANLSSPKSLPLGGTHDRTQTMPAHQNALLCVG